MSTASVGVPVARSYTRARRHPWVLGKLGEIRLWLGPYTRAQLVVAGVGLLVLGKTIPLWWPLFGPLPLVGLGFAVWAARCARIGGRVPEAAVWGWVLLLVQPRGGRIGGRPARVPAPRRLDGGFFLTETAAPPAPSDAPLVRQTDRDPSDHRLRVRTPSTGPLPSARPKVRRPRPSGRPRLTSAATTTEAVAVPRSPLDLLLEQAGARTSERS
ncbi:hypothetical protein [Streptacidiphilus neutrinimicus]|uniref:hypothetical protein n=1 Tax=Streptacidiphilus neutrinimicus TaxID=105420 RepID=UPI0006937919|nr:hypothetical protein [Streptacidiphilus neutrinimicus]